MKRVLVVGVLIALAACQSVPFKVQLANECDALATTYDVAAGYVAQGKFSDRAIGLMNAMEPEALVLCNPLIPPANYPAAINRVLEIARQMALLNAGVK